MTKKSKSTNVQQDYRSLLPMIQPYINDVLFRVQKHTEPINIVRVARQYGLSVLSSNVPQSTNAILRANSDSADACSADYSIIVSSTISFQEKRFAIAQQLGRYLMCVQSDHAIENVADSALGLFALCVLIPEDGALQVLQHVTQRMHNDLTIQQKAYCLQKKFDVTFIMAIQRVRMLQLLRSEQNDVSQQEESQNGSGQQRYASGLG